jgi:hypothetical protein
VVSHPIGLAVREAARVGVNGAQRRDHRRILRVRSAGDAIRDVHEDAGKPIDARHEDECFGSRIMASTDGRPREQESSSQSLTRFHLNLRLTAVPISTLFQKRDHMLEHPAPDQVKRSMLQSAR